MKLFSETGTYLAWVARVIGVFLRIRPGTTLVLIGASAVSQVASILASFLPLKAILLAASPTVPRYFPFVAEQDRDLWIMVFAAAAVAAYLLALALDSLSRKLVQVGSLDVLEGANDLAIMFDQRNQAQTYYGRICGIAGNFLFAITLLAVIPVLNRELFVAVSVLIAVAVLFTALISNRVRPDGGLRAVSALVEDKLSGYLSAWSSILFFVGFGVLLYPYVIGAGGNVLLAILSVLVLRQLQRQLSDVVGNSVAVWKQRVQINPLVFPEHQLRRTADSNEKQLRIVFSKERREELAKTVLERNGVNVSDLKVHWFDPILPNVHLFDISTGSGQDARRYQMQVFPGTGDQLVSERFLFEMVSRADLLAPKVLEQFSFEPYEIQVCESGESITHARFNTLQPEIRLKLWKVRPPEDLVTALSRSRALLWRRVDEESVKRMDLAVDTPEDAAIFDEILGKLSAMQRVIQETPLVIVNTHIGPRSVHEFNGDGGYRIMTWARWTLEPLGATLPGALDRDAMQQLLDELRSHRTDLRDVTVDHLTLAQKAWQLDRALSRGAYREALMISKAIVASPILGIDAERGAESAEAGGA